MWGGSWSFFSPGVGDSFGASGIPKRIKVMRREAIVEVKQRNKPSSDQTFSREIASFTKRSFCLASGISVRKGPYEYCSLFHSVGGTDSLMNHGNKFRGWEMSSRSSKTFSETKFSEFLIFAGRLTIFPGSYVQANEDPKCRSGGANTNQ